MTCGACHPEAFQSDDGGRVFGYAVSAHPGALSRQIQQLHFMGAGHVLVDHPVGQVRSRPGFKALCRVARDGDIILLGDHKCLGQKMANAESRINELNEKGLRVRVLNPKITLR